MVEAVLETLRKNRLGDACMRLVVTRGVGDLGVSPTNCKRPSVFIIAEPVEPSHGSPVTSSGISAIISSIRRDPVDATSHEVKSLNYLNSVLARWEAIEAEDSDAIMLDTRGFVSEATTENLFIVKKKQIATPTRVQRFCMELQGNESWIWRHNCDTPSFRRASLRSSS